MYKNIRRKKLTQDKFRSIDDNVVRTTKQGTISADIHKMRGGIFQTTVHLTLKD